MSVRNPQLKLIGRGHFSKVYMNSEDGLVYIKSDCIVKECMAHGWFSQSELFPEIEFCEERDYRKDFKYKMRFYPDMKERAVLPKLDKYNKQLYRELRKVQYIPYNSQSDFEEALYQLDIKQEHREALIEGFESLRNFTKEEYIKFEISPRNVATENGKLILMDCFFSTDFF